MWKGFQTLGTPLISPLGIYTDSVLSSWHMFTGDKSEKYNLYIPVKYIQTVRSISLGLDKSRAEGIVYSRRTEKPD